MSKEFSFIDEMDDELALERVDRLLKMKELRIDFAKNHHLNTHGQRMNFKDNPHLLPLYESTAPQMVLQGSVQSMKSEFVVIDHFACAATGMSVFFVLPKFESRGAYVQNRIDKCFQMVKEYQKRKTEVISVDNVVMKSFGKGTIKYVGSNVISDFKEFPADAIYVEEVDQCDQLNLEYGEDRLRGSRFQFKRWIGNPSTEGYGINKHYLRSTRQEWHVACDTCHELVSLDWFSTIVDIKYDIEGLPTGYDLMDDSWRAGKEIRPVCRHCGNPFSRYGGGEWLEQNPDSKIEGWLMTMMNSRLNSISEMFERFEDSFGDDAAYQHFHNSDLGIPYSPAGMCLSALLLDSLKEDGYRFVMDGRCAHVEGNRSIGPCSMGVDVGKNFDVKISRVLDDGTRIAAFIGEVTDKSELFELSNMYNVGCMVIDSMPEAKLVQEIQEEFTCFVWLCRYGSEGKDARLKKDKKARVVTVDRTSSLDRSFSAMKKQKVVLPENYSAIMGGDYTEEMLVAKRQSEVDKSGNVRYIWSKERKDHQRHADNYDLIASQMMVNSIDTLADISVG